MSWGVETLPSTKINVNVVKADAGRATRQVGTCVGNRLNGSGSIGYNLAYSWSSAPANMLSTSDAIARPTTKVLTQNTLFELRVTDDFGCSDAATTELLPTALQVSAGDDKTVTVCDNIILSGTASGGSGLTTNWVQVSGPSVTISNSNRLSQSLTHAGAGIYRFRLDVGDAYTCTASDEVAVTIKDVELDISAIKRR